MGVTCIEFDPFNPYSFATGCYDEKIRLWDIRYLSKEVNSLKRNGGVWRTIFDPNQPTRLLCGIYSEFYYEIIDTLSEVK